MNASNRTIDEAVVGRAILAIESSNLTPEELEHELLGKLIVPISLALRRGDTRDQIRGRLKANGIKLHYTKLERLFERATALVAMPMAQLKEGSE